VTKVTTRREKIPWQDRFPLWHDPYCGGWRPLVSPTRRYRANFLYAGQIFTPIPETDELLALCPHVTPVAEWHRLQFLVCQRMSQFPLFGDK
jgi:hypothetical protein